MPAGHSVVGNSWTVRTLSLESSEVLLQTAQGGATVAPALVP